jgi:acyl carrier protein
MSNEQKLELFNKLARHIRPAFYDYKDITDLDVALKDTGLDSLDFIMMGLYLGAIYGVPDNTAKDFAPVTAKELYDLMEQHQRKEPPATVNEAMEMVK